MDPMLDFTDKTVLITGAASGFGQALSKELANRGANLVLGDIDMAGLDSVAAELNGKAVIQRCDVGQEKDCQALVNLAIETYGKLDIAVNNAGIGHALATTTEVTEEIFTKQMDVNVKSVLMGMKYQVPELLKVGGGCILNVASMAGLGGAPKMAAYSAAKHAVIGLTKTTAVEYARKNIRVNAICPFFTPTNIGAGFLKEKENEENLSRGCPMKRFGKIEEIITAMLFLISPANTYMNGQALAVDGGTSAI